MLAMTVENIKMQLQEDTAEIPNNVLTTQECPGRQVVTLIINNVE